MRLSWKLFFITTPVFVLFLTVFGTWIIQDSFWNSLEQEIERCMAENQTFQNSYELTRNSLSNEQWGQTTVQKVVESFYHKGSAGDGGARIYDAEGAVMYQDNAVSFESLSDRSEETSIGQAILSRLDEVHNVGYEIAVLGQERYVVVVGRSSFGDYIETMRNISPVYARRDAMYARYQIGVLLLTVAVGGVTLVVLFFVMRNMQKLSHATRQFARGAYDARVHIKSEDEIGRLADDFNWMADAMSKQMQQLAGEVRRQEEFTAAFAHELKTPLTSIIGYADTIRQMELSKEETDMCADYIFRQGKRLQTLAYKLLELTMTGRQEITPEEIRMPDFLQEIRRTSFASLKEKRIALVTEAEEGVLYGDRDLLLSLFLNLIDNARKNSEPDTSIHITGLQEPGGYLVTVRDEGRGIPEEVLAHITDAFYMVDKSRARKEGGAGLGLALCQKIVEVHKAGWRFESKPGEGLTVSIMFWNPEKPVRRRRRSQADRRRR